ncbi:hypothetical protein [Aeromicrobium sp.]|uniref:hypothetical protein n=1 Tax=Aeromicrobium sp. TaxID=1871063 RepID=UPI002FC9132B
MKLRQVKSLGGRANAAVGDLAARVDDQTGEAAKKAARVIVLAVTLLRIPTALLMILPAPFIFTTLVLGLLADGGVRWVILGAGLAMLLVTGAFWGRRRRILQAVEEPDKLATELGIMISLTDKVEETRGAISSIAGAGGWRIFERLKGVWSGVAMTGRWIEGVGDLPRARYFGPPKIGTTVTVAVAALWLIPISVVVALLSLIGSIAGSI